MRRKINRSSLCYNTKFEKLIQKENNKLKLYHRKFAKESKLSILASKVSLPLKWAGNELAVTTVN